MSGAPGGAPWDALFQAYARAWADNDARAIAACWDGDGFLFYKAEEVERFFHRWEEVLEYWQGNESLHQAISLRFSDFHAAEAAQALTVVTLRMRWDIRFAANATLADGSAFAHRARAMGGDNHVLAFLGQQEEGWRLRGWSETPDAAITYLRGLYFRAADTTRV